MKHERHHWAVNYLEQKVERVGPNGPTLGRGIMVAFNEEQFPRVIFRTKKEASRALAVYLLGKRP